MDTTREFRRSTFTSPFRGLWDLVREMSRIADSTTSHELAQMCSGPESWRPFTDLIVRDNDVLICCDLTGVRRDGIAVTHIGDTLLITGNCEHGPGDGVTRHRSERCRGSFRREIALEPGVSREEVDAEISDGLLRITVRGTAEPSMEAKNIPVVTAAQVPAQRPSVEGVTSGEVPQEA
ncbi:Hsp20/alpha crystallin family protein [Nocardiopsis xinjiangensis]|uniref:Hsp20/alpha crystallin family protein n=1 Tax=Nocardiopsis xinjiangensis TaxID=124285 RepID=UPI00034A1A61|nr:Hsp20/alpha crystallin family protein [Nocardiopsis xinjiangensis]